MTKGVADTAGTLELQWALAAFGGKTQGGRGSRCIGAAREDVVPIGIAWNQE